jgi:hypothetical protein
MGAAPGDSETGRYLSLEPLGLLERISGIGIPLVIESKSTNALGADT